MQAVSDLQCSECRGTTYVDRDGFRWCKGCGVGVALFEAPHRAPGVGSKTHVPLLKELYHGRDLGNLDVNTMGQKRGFLEMLKQEGNENLGIRAIVMKNECMKSQESQNFQSFRGPYTCGTSILHLARTRAGKVDNFKPITEANSLESIHRMGMRRPTTSPYSDM